MSYSRPVGGFFELELRRDGFLHDDAILLNSGRACFEYALQDGGATKVYLPKFTCDVMLEPLMKLGIAYEFYHINEQLEIVEPIVLSASEFIVYTNYFGSKDAYSRVMSEQYGDQLILDCSQAYYFKPLERGYTFYSPRKFFGLSDGGCLYGAAQPTGPLPIDESFDRMSHLLKRIDRGPEEAYGDFKRNDKSLEGEPVKQMSYLTRALMGNIDFEQSRKQRRENVKYLHEALDGVNMLAVDVDQVSCPMVYPFLTNDPALREVLIQEKIYVATYWPNVFEWCGEDELEHELARKLLPLPIDQRYTIEDMARIVEIVKRKI